MGEDEGALTGLCEAERRTTLKGEKAILPCEAGEGDREAVEGASKERCGQTSARRPRFHPRSALRPRRDQGRAQDETHMRPRRSQMFPKT